LSSAQRVPVFSQSLRLSPLLRLDRSLCTGMKSMASCLQSEYCNLTATMTVQDMIDLNAAQLAEASVYQLRPARFRSGVAAESRGGCGGSPSVSKSQRVSHAFQSDSPGPKAKWTSQRSLSSSITDPAVFRGQEKKKGRRKLQPTATLHYRNLTC
jgi:hypothetical protein